MKVATFKASGGPVDAQAVDCFQRLLVYLDGLGQRLPATHSLVVEVSDRRAFAPVTAARRQVFGDQKPGFLSRRLTRLPPGQLVRVTITTRASTG